MSTDESERGQAFEARHAAIIARTLSWADYAATRDDYVQAVHWVETVRALGHQLTEEYQAKHEAWLSAIDQNRGSVP